MAVPTFAKMHAEKQILVIVQAEVLGLTDTAVAAKVHVQSRRAQLMARIHAAKTAKDGTQLAALQDVAVQLGLGGALTAISASLAQRTRDAEEKLETAARTADQQMFDASVQVQP